MLCVLWELDQNRKQGQTRVLNYIAFFSSDLEEMDMQMSYKCILKNYETKPSEIHRELYYTMR
jgi:hypothetical protein